MWFSTLLASDIFAGMTGMTVAPDLYSPEYTSDNPPVQFGSLDEIKRYLKRGNPPQLSRYLRELDEYAKGIQLGTHRGVAHKKEGEYNYSVFAHRDEFFECDLMDIYGKRPQHIFKLNDGYVFALIVINAQTKMVCVRLLKTKGGMEVAKATKEIFTLDGKPEIEGFKEVMLHSDHGKYVATVLVGLHLHLYSSHSDHKAAAVERVIRTLCERLVKAMELKGGK